MTNYQEIDQKICLKASEVLKVRNLYVKFKVKNGFIHAVRGISLTIKQGQIVGIVGESGSGKSAISKSFIGFNDNAVIDANLLNLCNTNLLKLKKHQWKYIRTYIGYIPQDPFSSLNPTKKIGKQISEAIIVSEKRRYQQKRRKILDSKLKKSEKKTLLNNLRKKYRAEINRKNVTKKIIDILSFINIENAQNWIHSFPHEISGGMRQRIVIAIAIAARPKLIIADEPTTALDVTVQAKVLDLIKKVRDTYNIAVIFISHNISLVANFCDYVYVMYAGKIVEQGTIKDVLTDPRHPYTWALIGAIPENIDEKETLEYIPGTPLNLLTPPIGDAFAARNKYALKIDFEKEPPLFTISKTHKAATWLLNEFAPKIPVPEITMKKIKIIRDSLNRNENFSQKENEHST